jgi:hypothetical protein
MQLPEMLPLPTPYAFHTRKSGEGFFLVDSYTADQMRAYAKEYALLVLSEASLGACPAGTALSAPAADAASAPIAGAGVLAPSEPTAEMQVAGFESPAWGALMDAVIAKKGWPYSCRDAAECVTAIYKAMISVRPAETRYQKEGESVLECIERHRSEQDALLSLLSKERKKIADADKALRSARQFLLKLNGANTPLAIEFNNILRALGTFELDATANANREAAARSTPLPQPPKEQA